MAFFSQWLSAQVIITLPIAPLLVSSGYGYRIHPISKKIDQHTGVDLPVHSGMIKSMMSGKVIGCGYHALLGNYVRISHGQIESIYGHLSRILVNMGQDVETGQCIGFSGQSGSATGEHLHFAITYRGMPIHPLRFITEVMQKQLLLAPHDHE
ncbi:M23 family metallopeptidase [Pedobacter frigidisoli]|nr:M23 family metallopeptidase [Pedobacter frigidisoli]